MEYFFHLSNALLWHLKVGGRRLFMMERNYSIGAISGINCFSFDSLMLSRMNDVLGKLCIFDGINVRNFLEAYIF